ncbi:MAG: PQQ-binding-like beta-propeller repeat protein [Thermogemmata sp.]|nr:PQQ-binding-like beta-propeller repeat protein [Thermogemmata sp.]
MKERWDIQWTWITAGMILFGGVGICGSDWPGYRGPTADGRAPQECRPPLTWSERENVRWKVAIHGKGWSSPVVLGEQIWLTTADEVRSAKVPPQKKGDPPPNPVERVSFYAVCVDRDSGRITHDICLATEENPAYCHPFNSYASCTPFVEADHVYVHFGSHGTWCLDRRTGKVVWERRDLRCNHFRGPASSPVVYGDLLYLIFDGFDQQYVVALDKRTGKTVWKRDRNIQYRTDNGDYKKAYATAALFVVEGQPQLVCPSAECTIAYDPLTGDELWRVVHGGMNGAARPVMAHGLLYLTSGHDGRLLAIRPTGRGLLGDQAIVWQTRKGVPTRPSLLLDGDLLYMVSDQGIASCLDARTGKVYYSERLDGEFSASPIWANGYVYYCNQNGKTFVVKAGREFILEAENRLDDGCMASPAVSGNALILRTRTHLYRLEKP